MIAELKNISKYYQNPGSEQKREVLNNISFKINKGDSIAVVGPSGCGKSTLLNIIGTLDKPTSGEIYFKERNLADLDDNSLSLIRNQDIGFVFQQHHLLPQLNIIENVLSPLIPVKDKNAKKEAVERANELLHAVNLYDKIYQKPGQLSGGECQRVAVVRALVNNPDLILADEPTGSLDQDSANQIGELLVEMNKKRNITMVVVTHSMEIAKMMGTMYHLTKGSLK